MFRAAAELLNVKPIMQSLTIAGPPLLPGLIAASTWMRRPETGKL